VANCGLHKSYFERYIDEYLSRKDENKRMNREGKITENQIIGRKGEHAIENRLSSFSNIMRPEHDVGIDYFCELIERESPAGRYFCVQAKSTKSFGDCWIRGVKKETVRSWLNQRYPVFLIVYDESNRNCYWVSIHDNRRFLIDKLNSSAKTIAIRVSKSNVLEESGANIAFVRKVKSDSVLINALHGVPEFISEGGYVGFIPVLSLTDVASAMIREKVRQGIDYLIYDYILKEDFQRAYELSKILAQFDQGHYDHFLIHARICTHLGKYEEAEENYDTAIKICKDDPNWNKRKGPNDPSIQDIIQMVADEKARFKQNPQL
jgi:tetratricopeptide (TPR) repeat protein